MGFLFCISHICHHDDSCGTFARSFRPTGSRIDRWITVGRFIFVECCFSERLTAVGALYHLRQIGGVGFGFGYVCPIAASVKWFPDKKGVITGLAVTVFLRMVKIGHV